MACTVLCLGRWWRMRWTCPLTCWCSLSCWGRWKSNQAGEGRCQKCFLFAESSQPHCRFLFPLYSHCSMSLLRAGQIFFFYDPCFPIRKYWLNKTRLSIQRLPYVGRGQSTSRNAKRMKTRECLGPGSQLHLAGPS